MNDIVIQANNLRKVYRLYSEPRFRLLGMLGLLPSRSHCYTERAALDGIDLDIRRGEKLAIIGRNGAGKSTLLKLISRVIYPTEGTIDIRVKTQALLQIGTGFHPDFTGRENVYSYLSHLGCHGVEADQLVREIIDFAEIEDYIDQPVKTYSSGMGMRLMFAASTAIVPEVLVIDEVLGVGDAYFAQKSFERISELAKGKGTTVLLVTHDVYSAASLCDRMMWLEQGQVLMDGDPKTVVDRYEASIRDQEEQRLRSKRLAAIQENLDETIAKEEKNNADQLSNLRTETAKAAVEQASIANAKTPVIFGQLRCVGNVPIDTPLPIQRISFFWKDTLIGEIHPGEAPESESMALLLNADDGNWSDEETSDGRQVRNFQPWGSIFHRAPFTIRSPAVLEALDQDSLCAEIVFKDTAKLECYIELLYSNGNRRARGEIDNACSGEWATRKIAIRPNAQIETTRPAFNRYGTQALRIVDIAFLDRDGNEQHLFETGSFMRIRLHYRLEIPDFKEKPLVMLAFMKEGTARSHRLVLDDTEFDSNERQEGTLEVVTEPVLLSEGEYLINVMVMRAGAYGRVERNIFFTVNDKVLDAHSRAYHLKIVSKDDGPLTHNTVFVHPAKWIKDGVPCIGSGVPEL